MYRDNLFKKLIVDNFAGGGGASVGIELALGVPVDIAINYVADIGLRMLKAHELMLAQGFPPDYIIDIEPYIGKPYSKAKQRRDMTKHLFRLKRELGEAMKNMRSKR